ncbi:MAG: hypothetical protein IT270_17770, partial [Saprospiraceae bacterium]|nr:hypothetical protein [Saprospiraceae bacterium]
MNPGTDLKPDAVDVDHLFCEAFELLGKLISTPSFSREEAGTADVLEAFFAKNKIKTSRVGNNVWATNKHFAEGKPTILLCSHHD